MLTQRAAHLHCCILSAASPACSYVGADELIEVTPTKLRLRKRTLESGMRRQQKRREEALAA